ncbi:hypothetical protein FVEN_g7750 [Fusarium venenatum]|uniref:FAD-binding FR-type domain-containing protein n=1 Tax=Fusarium venenatum TaxID=56646 RepID=A0A2L2TRY3_9HYPO|nr:uncharacterized protein FVRRES_08054 [Fusarium venenatum]KAG8354312.1 hypothetical protein FVEN_g7750 [Fusarium venenatum]KAH6964842.1 hypothetical protein EDB82DRAFT_511111 [Fusarium venenatum]CEI67977.1 unnamed protein product [Fusarium venenatum]
MQPWQSLACFFILVTRAAASGIEGYGLTSYDPLCAETCLRSLSSLLLSCSEHGDGHGHMMMAMVTTPACRANDTAFLTSTTWCLSVKCADQHVSKLEAYWEEWVTGDKDVVPKWTYSEALAEVDPRPPSYHIADTDMSLNETSVVNPDIYLKQWNVLGHVRHEIFLESTYGIVLIAVAFGLPVLMSWLRYMPFMSALCDRLKPYILYPSMIGTYSVHPLPFQIGNAPTVGQGLYIAIFVILNVVLTAVGYRTAQPNAWFMSSWQELIAYLLYRTGAFAFTLLPVLLVFSSRNNLLLWMTNWSHPTYLLLHRWVGRLFTLYAVLHSIFGLLAYRHYEKTVWWAWGAAATVFSVVLSVGSGLYVRRKNYEVFLLVHIILSVIIIVGCWYHLVLWYESMGMHVPDYTSGYEVWLYIAFAVWAFDRIIRIGRLLGAGIKRSKVTDIGNDYVRIDIAGTRWTDEPGKHLYAYFPTLSLYRPWENHPFSIIPTGLLQTLDASLAGSPLHDSANGKDLESTPQNTVRRVSVSSDEKRNSGDVTLFVKKAKGITKYLQPAENLLTLVEGPYGNNNKNHILPCDRVLLIGGGIGITSLIPWILCHWNVKLVWSVKASAQCLVDELEPCINTLDQAQRNICIGSRFDISALIDEEVAMGWKRIGVVVSGPGSLCDDVRAKVAAAGKASKAIFELEVDAYSW